MQPWYAYATGCEQNCSGQISHDGFGGIIIRSVSAILCILDQALPLCFSIVLESGPCRHLCRLSDSESQQSLPHTLQPLLSCAPRNLPSMQQ